MLKVKNLTHLTPKKLKKGGNLDHGCKKNRALLDFLDFFLQPSVAFWLDFNQNFVLYRMNVISRR